MGCGSWTRDSYVSYSTTKGMSVSTDGMISGSYSNQDMFKARNIDSALDPKNVIRECCDTEEHPNTIPVILALDVTGSMGQAAAQNNCVASYIDKVIDGKCHILFLRKRNKPDESLVTIEVRNNHIVQARRRFNDDVTAEDQKAIDAFNKKFANKEDKAA